MTISRALLNRRSGFHRQSARVLVHPCPVCHSEAGLPHIVSKASLEACKDYLYFECQDCGCLFLTNGGASGEQIRPPTELLSSSGPSAFVRQLLAAFHVWPPYIKAGCIRKADLEMLRRARLTKENVFLDMGPGASIRASALRRLGYKAHAIDISTSDSIASVTRTIANHEWPNDMPAMYDLILLRHSLERLPTETLAIMRKHLTLNGRCIACVVLLGWAWRTYGTDWAQLNAPFHRLIHTSKSFSLLSTVSGFAITRVVFDSTEGQIWGSDALQRNVPLSDLPQPSRSQRVRMRRIAEALNLQQQGDSAQFYLQAV